MLYFSAAIDRKCFKRRKNIARLFEPQDLGSVSYKDMTTSEVTQQTQSVDPTSTVLQKTLVLKVGKIIPDDTPEKQYEFAKAFKKLVTTILGKSLKEFVQTNPNHQLN